MGWMIGPDVGLKCLHPLVGQMGEGIGVVPYPNHTACKYRHSTYQHGLVVGFVSDGY